MKRISPFYAFAGFEVLRYFTLSWILEVLLPGYPPQVLRFLAAPNLMFGAAFFFIAMDPVRYGSYRPLMLVGKAVAVFAALVAAPGFFGIGGVSLQPGMTVLAGIGLVVLWDIVAALVLLFHRFPEVRLDGNQELPAGPEVVEVE
ncbi:MAG: hypothetical protein RBT68_15085 [Spirochaetia bacterium]|jgi:hypothetical protein|nr:hypothetical protein [Spirochaetia bacterium]